MIKTQDYLREFITILFIRKQAVIVISLVFIVGACGIALLWPPTYAAHGSILLKRNEALTSPESIEDVNPEMTRVMQGDLFSEMELLESNSVVDRAAERLIEKYDRFNSRYGTDDGKDVLSSSIKQNLSVQLVPQSNVLEATLAWGDPTDAQAVLEVYFQEYLSYRSELYNPKEALAFFEDQLTNFNRQLRQREETLVEMAQTGNVSDVSEQIKTNLMIQENVEQQLTKRNNELHRKVANISHIQESLASRDFNFFSSVDNLEIGDYGQELQSLIQEKEDLLKTYTPESNKVQRMQEQIDSTYESLKAEVQRYVDAQESDMEGIRNSIADMREKLEKLESRNVELYKSKIQRNSINREIDLLNQSYETFGKRLEQASIKSRARTDTLFNVGILSKSTASTTPVFPDKGRVIGLGIVIGVIVGITMGFVLEFFDHTFKRPEDVYNFTDLPHVCSLPRW